VVQVRQQTGKPTTTTEIFNLNASDRSQIIALGDWYFPNTHPYYNCHWNTQDAADWTVQMYHEATVLAGGKALSFKEVGLPEAHIDQWPCDATNMPQPSQLT